LLLVHCLQSFISIVSWLETHIAEVFVVSLLIFGNGYWVDLAKLLEERLELVFIVILGNIFYKQVIELFLYILPLLFLLMQRQLEFLTVELKSIQLLDGLVGLLFSLILNIGVTLAGAILEAFKFTWNDLAVIFE
jgi:hypothetical protein